MARERRQIAERRPAELSVRARWRSSPRLRFHPRMGPRVLQELGLWNSSGESGDSNAWNVILDAVADRLGAPGFADARGDDEQHERQWLRRHSKALEGLRRAWRVEAAREDLQGLWDRIDNDAPVTQFNELEGEYSAAAVRAAHAAVAEWDADLVANPK